MAHKSLVSESPAMNDSIDDDDIFSSEIKNEIEGVIEVTRDDVYGHLDVLTNFADRQSLRILKEMRDEARNASANKRKSAGFFTNRKTEDKDPTPYDIFNNKLNAYQNAPVRTLTDLMVGVRLIGRSVEKPDLRDAKVKEYLVHQSKALFTITDDFRNNYLQVLAYNGDIRTINIALEVVKEYVGDSNSESDSLEEEEAPEEVIKFLLARNYFGDAMSDTAAHRKNDQISQRITEIIDEVAPGNSLAVDFHVENILKRNKNGRLNFDYLNGNRRFIQIPVIEELLEKHGIDLIREDIKYNEGQYTKSVMERAIRGDDSYFDFFFPNPATAIMDVGLVDEAGHDWIDEILIAGVDDCFLRIDPLFMKYGEIVFGDSPAKNRADRIEPNTALYDSVQSYFRDRKDINGKTALHLAVENFDRDKSDNLLVLDIKKWLTEDTRPFREMVSRFPGGDRKAKAMAQLQAMEAANVDRMDDRDDDGMNVFHSAMMKDRLEALRLLFAGFTNNQIFRILSKMVVSKNDKNDKKRMLFYGLARIEETYGNRCARYVMKLASESKFEDRFKELMQREKAKRRVLMQQTINKPSSEPPSDA